MANERDEYLTGILEREPSKFAQAMSRARMSGAELAALTAFVHRETAEFEGCVRQFGERPWDPFTTPAFLALKEELERRLVLPAPV